MLTQTDSIDDTVQKCCQLIGDLTLEGITEKQLTEYKKRKLITEV